MPATEILETERKYDVEDGTTLPPLGDLPGVGRVDTPAEQLLVAEYFDTDDFLLASRQITLRRRTGGGDAGWHLKLPSSPDERKEYREPLGPETDDVPEPLLRLVRVHVRDRALAPVARLRTRRTVHRLCDNHEGVLADFSDDHVQAETLVPEQTTQHWREWEIELIDGSTDLLEAGQDMLTAAGVQRSAHGSKLTRALGEYLPPTVETPPPPKRKGAASAVVLAYIREQVQALEAQDPLVRLDAHDAVHRMRVATRRMRSGLATYRKLLDDADTVNFLRGELKWLAGVLGEARDAEVMHQRLKDMIAEEPVELILGPVTRRVDVELGASYQQAHAKALEELNGQRYFRLLDALESLLASPPLTKLGSRVAHKVIPKLIKRDAKRLRAAVREAEKRPAGSSEDPALHEARKRGKRLRYAAEAAVPIGRKKAVRLADAAHGVQKILGDHQDSVVTRDLLRRLGVEAFLQGENGFSYGRLHALEQSVAVDSEARFYRLWKKFPSASVKL
jgi:CHAD domain-containing protein